MLGGTQCREKIDEEILSRMSNGAEQEINEPELQEGIRRLYLAGKIRKRKEGTRVFYRLAEDGASQKEEPLEVMTVNDRMNISRMARKFRSCRYELIRDEVAANGLKYTLTVTKKGYTCRIIYVPNGSVWSDDTYAKMLENDRGIRIVVPDIPTKLFVAKKFDDFVRNSYPGENPLLSFNQMHLFCLLTIDQFFQKTTWKSLVR